MDDRDDHVRKLLAERIAAARARLIGGLPDRVAEFAALAEAAAGDGPEAQAARDALTRGLHSLAGSAPTIGLAALGARARALEAALAAQPPGRLTPEFSAGLVRDLKQLASVAS